MRPGSPILVGASPSPPPQSQDYGAAFYDQFKVHYLRPLDESEMRALLVHLADAARARRCAPARRATSRAAHGAATTHGRQSAHHAHAFFSLCRGLRAQRFRRSRGPAGSRHAALQGPLRRAHAAAAGRRQRHRESLGSGDRRQLADATGLPAGTISAQLDRLEKTGVVERTELFGETRTGYQLAERFFNIWFLMRSASRRQRREVEFLTRFLESFSSTRAPGGYRGSRRQVLRVDPDRRRSGTTTGSSFGVT